jgi:Ca-activated chloride channel family protein
MDEILSNTESWFSFHWFYPQELTGFHWEYEIVLYTIPLVPFIYFLRWLFHFNFRQKLEIAFPSQDLRKWQLTGLLRFVPNIFFILFLTLAIFALARPQKISEKVESFSEGIDVLFALDISESMMLEDFTPNRLESAKKIIRKFINERDGDRIGIVVFSGTAYTLVPLTTDKGLLLESLEETSAAFSDTGSTAIGNAMAVAISRLNKSVSPTKVLILISDGENTGGNIGPETAAQLAYAYNIKVYTIGIGKDGNIPYGKDEQGNTRFVSATLNEVSLKKIAEIGKGIYLRAKDENSLTAIFDAIKGYEKGKIREIRFKDTKDYYQVYLTWGVVFFLVWMFTKSTFLTNALED